LNEQTKRKAFPNDIIVSCDVVEMKLSGLVEMLKISWKNEVFISFMSFVFPSFVELSFNNSEIFRACTFLDSGIFGSVIIFG
jgi:hypothetical protein